MLCHPVGCVHVHVCERCVAERTDSTHTPSAIACRCEWLFCLHRTLAMGRGSDHTASCTTWSCLCPRCGNAHVLIRHHPLPLVRHSPWVVSQPDSLCQGQRPHFSDPQPQPPAHPTHPFSAFTVSPCHLGVVLQCRGCTLPIKETGVSACSASWHTDHFVCVTCKKPFEDGQ